MQDLKFERMSVDFALLLARRRAEKREPFSAAWDAAIRDVEDMEREAFRLDEVYRARQLTRLSQQL